MNCRFRENELSYSSGRREMDRRFLGNKLSRSDP